MQENPARKYLPLVLPLLIALISVFILSGYASSAQFHADSLAGLEEKQATVLELSAASAAASAAITLIPGDTATPIADKLADLSSHFLVVLCAIGVAGRAFFFMLPQFKPMAAVAILAGVSLGGEAGFVVGAASMLASNFFFVQGVWTPWQMAAMGLIGLLAGWLAPWVGKSRLSLCLYGFFAVVLLYGGVMNPASVLMAQPNPTWEMVAASWALGLPVDVVHGGATAFFLWAGGPALLRILERVKTKYGLEGGQ